MCVSGAVSPSGVVAQTPAAGETLTVEQAVALGLQHNRSLRSSELEVGKAQQELAAFRTRRYPAFQVDVLESRLLANLTFEFGTGAFGTFPSTGPIPGRDTPITTSPRWTTTMLLRVTQPISQLYRIGLAERQLELARDIAGERLRARRHAVTVEVRRVCYGVLQTQHGIAARDQALALHKEIQRLVSEYVREGAALAGDALEVAAVIAAEEAELRALRNSLASLHEQLNALLGRDIDTRVALAPLADDLEMVEDVAALETRALASRPELKEAALTRRQAEYGVRITRAELFPDVSAMFNYVGFHRFEVLPTSVATAGVMVSWEPFDWGRRRRELSSKEKTVEQAATAAREAEVQVRREVRAAVRGLDEARARVRAARLAADAARERLRVATDSYREQRALLREVLEAQTALARASAQHTRALTALEGARAELDRALGEP